VPFAIGVLLERSLHRRAFLTVIQGLALFAFLGLSFLTGFTGYLGPSFQPDVDEEARLRFSVLHLVVLPALIGALIVVWAWLFRAGSGQETDALAR